MFVVSAIASGDTCKITLQPSPLTARLISSKMCTTITVTYVKCRASNGPHKSTERSGCPLEGRPDHIGVFEAKMDENTCLKCYPDAGKKKVQSQNSNLNRALEPELWYANLHTIRSLLTCGASNYEETRLSFGVPGVGFLRVAADCVGVAFQSVFQWALRQV